jgi:signal transduction histidine kinase
MVVVASVAGSFVGSAPDRVQLVACAVAYLAVLAGGGRIVERRHQWRRAHLLVLLVLGCATVWVARGSSTLILMPLLCIVVVYHSVSTGLALTALLTGWVVFVLLRSQGGLRPVLTGAASFLAAAAFVIVFSRLLVRERAAATRIERLAAELEAKNRQLHSYAEKIQELATAQERTRIAREIHDGLGHYLTGAHVHLETARALVDSGGARAAAEIQRAQKLLHQGLGELRQSVTMLRSPDTDRPFSVALAALIDDARASGIEAKLHVGGSVRPLGTSVEFVLYRAAQEGLTNVLRHAHAEKVDLRLRYAEECVELNVEDDGVGSASLRQGFGLVGIRERVATVGGEVDLATAPSGGFALRVRVPA